MRRTSRVLLVGITSILAIGAALEASNAQDAGPEPLGFTEAAKLLPSGGHKEDHFGTSVAIFGDVALVGVPLDDDKGTDSGSVRVFLRSAEGWSEEAKLLAADGAAFDNFGISVALDGDTALVGADLDNTAKGADSGSVYVFVRNGGSWSQQAKLVAGDGAAFDLFGGAVALAGDTAIVGAEGDDDKGDKSGSAYAFVRNGSAWSFQDKLIALDGQKDDGFGTSVAISGERAVLGAPGDDDLAESAGAAYSFTRSGGAWSQENKLLSPDPGSYDLFGWSVALSGVTALIGAPGEDEGNGPVRAVGPPAEPTSFRGSAYVFLRTGSNWSFEGNLQPKEITTYDEFGYSVSIAGGRAAVGVWLDDPNGEDSGSAYAFGPGALDLSVTGNCPGTVTVNVANATPGSEVGIAGAANNGGFTMGGQTCTGTVLEIGEPFQLPPLWIKVNALGDGSGQLTLEAGRCWVEALAVVGCATSGAVWVP